MALTQVSTDGIKNGTIATADLANSAVSTAKIANGAVSNAKIVDGAINNAKVVSDAAIAGTKISPDFGSQTISTTGVSNLSGELRANGNIKITNANPKITLTDSNNDDDFEVKNNNGVFTIRDATDSADRFTIASNGRATLANDAGVNGNLDVGNGLDVTGAIFGTVSSANSTMMGLTANMGSNNNRSLIFKTPVTDSASEPFRIQTSNSVQFDVDGQKTLFIDSSGQVNLHHDGSTVKLHTSTTGISVGGNIAVTGTVDGRDLQSDGAFADSLYGGSNGTIKSTVVLNNGVTATTQSAGDSSTKVATTAYTDTAIANLIDSSPGTLNTLNELAAALGDDANFSTTVTNSIATKMPLAGGTFSGDVTFNGGGAAATIAAGSDIRFTNGDWTGNTCKIQHHADRLYIVGGSSGIRFREGGSDRALFDGNGHFIPAVDSQYNLGSTSLRFANVYADTLYGDGSNITGVNADTLDGAQGSQFLRSDSTDTCSGQITFTNAVISSKNGDRSTQGGNALVLTHATTTALRANHFIHDDFPSGSGTYYIQVTESGVSNDRNMCLQGYGGKLGIGMISEPTATVDITGTFKVSNSSTFSGDATFNGGASAVTINAGSDIRFTNGNWTGESCKIQQHDNRLYIQGGSNGIQLRGSDGGGIVNFTNTSGTFFDAVTFNGDVSCSGGAGAITINANSDIRLANGNWTGNSDGKIQHHNNFLYISGGTSGIIFREGSSNRWRIDGDGHFEPGLSGQYDIGATDKRVRNIYTNDLHLSNEGSINDVDGTWGSYTIQEGEESLFLINKRNGKKYRFNLTEVS